MGKFSRFFVYIFIRNKTLNDMEEQKQLIKEALKEMIKSGEINVRVRSGYSSEGGWKKYLYISIDNEQLVKEEIMPEK